MRERRIMPANQQTVRKSMVAFLHALFVLLLCTVCGPIECGASAADFDCNGNICIKLGDDIFLTRDDLHLLENGKQVDAIDWRIKGAPSPLDGTVSRKGANQQKNDYQDKYGIL